MYKKGSCKHLDDWINIVKHKKQRVNEEQRQLIHLVESHLKDPEVIVDIDKINDAIDFIETYRPYKMTPLQRFILACVAGLFYKDGSVVFREFFIYAGRGFGKNSLIADISFYLSSNRHGIKRYNVDMVANSEEQAKTSFMDIHETISEDRRLEQAYSKTLVRIKFKKLNCQIKYWTSNASTKDGLRPGAIVFDEIHEYENYEMINVFTSALGKVQNPRIFYITTDGYVREGVLDNMLRIANEVLSGSQPNRRMFPLICRIEKLEEWEDPENWVKANPNLPYLPTLQQEMEQYFIDAQDTQSSRIEFLTKRLNFPLQDTTVIVATHEQLMAASESIDIDLKGFECIGGVDYADVRDFIGVGLLFRKGNMRYWIQHTFIVEQSLKLTTYNQELLRLGEEKGLYTVVPGVIADEQMIADWFLEKAKKYRIRKIAGDSFRLKLLKETFDKNGLPYEEVRSGPYTHNLLAPTIDSIFANELIRWGDNAFMRWYVNNTKVVTDKKGNKTYHKIEQIRRKTDGFHALIHALTLEGELRTEEFKYRSRIKGYTY